jgi:hypothetical protein
VEQNFTVVEISNLLKVVSHHVTIQATLIIANWERSSA